MSSQNISSTSQPQEDKNSWIPDGFKEWDDNIAFRFVEGKKCSIDIAEACAHYEVFTRYGCSDTLYMEVSFLDEDGTQVDWSNDTAKGMEPGEKAILEFVSFEETAEKVKVAKISCY